jgi:hypothetical protein
MLYVASSLHERREQKNISILSFFFFNLLRSSLVALPFCHGKRSLSG